MLIGLLTVGDQNIGRPSGSTCIKEVVEKPRTEKKEETQAGIKIAGRNINNLRYADDTTLGGKWQKVKRNSKAS